MGTQEQLKSLKRNKKLVKKLAKQYDMFIASSTLIKKIPRLLGPTLNKIGKFPLAIMPNEEIKVKVDELNRTIKGNIKFKIGMPMSLAFGIGNCSQDEEIIKRN